MLLDGHAWRLFLLHDREDALWILVSERGDVRGELVGKIARRSLLPDLVGLPLLALLIWLAVGGPAPAGTHGPVAQEPRPDNLAPLLLAPLPQELEPVAASPNRLLQQVNQPRTLHRRRCPRTAHTAGGAAHPCTERATGRQRGGARTGSRTADRRRRPHHPRGHPAADLARLEPSAQRLGLTDLDLLPLCRETLAELTPLALACGQELTLDVDELADFHLSGDAASPPRCCNLVGNALQYTPDGGQIQVGLQATAAAITLQVDDSGPCRRDAT